MIDQQQVMAAGAVRPSARAHNLAVCAAIGLLLTGWQIGMAVLIGEREGIVNRWEAGLFQWDSKWFHRVAENGYALPEKFDRDTPGNFAFLPAYPLVSRLVSQLSGLDLHTAMLITAELCCWGFWTCFLLMLREAGASREVTALAVGLIILHPASFFLVAAYSESLCMFCLFSLLYCLERPGIVNLLVACLCGFLITSARLVGIALILYPLARAVLSHFGGPRVSWGRALTVALATVAGIGSYLLFCEVRFGDWLLFMKSSQAGWGVELHPFAILDWRVYVDGLTTWNEYPLDPDVLSAVCAVYGLLALGGMAIAEWVSWRRRGSEGWQRRLGIYFCAAILLVVPFATHGRIHLRCLSRFSLPVIALLALEGGLLAASQPNGRQRRWLPWMLGTLIVLGAIANGLMTMRFVSGEQWVASVNEPDGSRQKRRSDDLATDSKVGFQAWRLTAAVDDPASREVVRGDFDFDAIARDNADKVLAHAAGDMRNHFAADVQLDPKLRIGQRFLDAPVNFNCFFFGHGSIALPAANRAK